MSTHTDEKRYLSDLTVALRLRNISGARIGDILAEIETHTAESGQSPREAFGDPKEYAKQFEPTPAEATGRRPWGRQTWTGVLTTAIGAWLYTTGAFAGMDGNDVMGIPGWWACAIGGAVLLITFSLIPIDAIVDPRRAGSRRYGRKWLMTFVAGALVVVLLAVVGLMTVIG